MSKTRNITLCAVFTAIIAALAQIIIPMPFGVPLTLQTFAVSLCGYLLGFKKGTVSTAVYILIGLVGIPVFSGFTGGIGSLFGKTGGFIIGFLFLVIFCGLSVKTNNLLLEIIIGFGGLIICHIIGTAQFSILLGMGFFKSSLLVSLPFLPKDIICVIAAAFFANKARPFIIKK